MSRNTKPRSHTHTHKITTGETKTTTVATLTPTTTRTPATTQTDTTTNLVGRIAVACADGACTVPPGPIGRWGHDTIRTAATATTDALHLVAVAL